MTAAEVLDLFRERGVTLYAQGGRLRFRGPRGALTASLRQTAADHRDELLKLLQPTAASDGSRTGRPLWVLIDGTYPVRVKSLRCLPDGASWWCHEGDAHWTQLPKWEQSDHLVQRRIAKKPKPLGTGLLDQFL
jgi:hypothetical protein